MTQGPDSALGSIKDVSAKILVLPQIQINADMYYLGTNSNIKSMAKTTFTYKAVQPLRQGQVSPV